MSALAYFEQTGESIELSKGDIVFNQGDTNDSIYYIKTGLLKAYYVTDDGREFVKTFIKEADVIGSLTALMSDNGCSFALVCLEPCTLIRLPFADCLKLAEQNLEVANIFIKLLTKLAIKKERREYEFLCLSAEERYQLLQENTPDLLKRVTQNDIARYLGITPVGLSRIRSRLRA